jgi:periplasmic divalent cation tolerance protein
VSDNVQLSKYLELVLTCSSWHEAQTIADHLLNKKLVACAEFIEVKSHYLWQGELDKASEIKLIMQSLVQNFSIIEEEISRLHSYKTFILQSLPIMQISSDAVKWLEAEIN